MRSNREKTYDLGVATKALIELHLEQPKYFNAETVLKHLCDKYEQLQLDPIKPYEEIKEQTKTEQ